MIETLDAYDQQLLVWLNGWHWEWMDPLMWHISATATWIPFYALLVAAIARSQFRFDLGNWRQWGALVISVTVCILLADQIASGLFKPFFARLRPSHQPNLEGMLHLLTDANGSVYKGGTYGFVSSHAANSVAVAYFGHRLLQNSAWSWTLGIWALVVSYSRIYLGVHYPGDILGGAIIGLIAAMFSVKLYFYLKPKIT